jgi:hypothetical protein
MMAPDVSHRRDAMDQARRLKPGAIFFTIFWIGGMLWWSGEYHPANIIILAICGIVGGYLWYLAMRWFFERMHLLPLNGDHGAGGETPR